MSDQTPPVVANIDDVIATPEMSDTNPRRGSFEASLGFIGRVLQTEGIGINVTRVPPKSKAWPKHYHFINHEMFIILAGTGTLHYGDTQQPLKARDVVFIRAGTGIPFQIENTSDAELEYLGLSTLEPADVFHYVDADKYGIMANRAPFRSLGADEMPRFARWIDADTSVGYWDNEPDAS